VFIDFAALWQVFFCVKIHINPKKVIISDLRCLKRLISAYPERIRF